MINVKSVFDSVRPFLNTKWSTVEMRIEKATKEGRLYKCGYCDKLFIYLTLTLEDLSGPKLEKKPTDIRFVIDIILAMQMS